MNLFHGTLDFGKRATERSSGDGHMMLRSDELQAKINSIEPIYMPMNLEDSFYKNKVTAVKKLNEILKDTNRKCLQVVDFKHIVLCSLTTVYYFGMRIKLNRKKSFFNKFCAKRKFQQAELAFLKTMDLLSPERTDTVIKITLQFFTEVSLWPYESFVVQILEIILYFSGGKMTLFNIMLTDIHCVLFHDVKSARHRMRVLYDLLQSKNWVIDQLKLLPFITRLLDFFAYTMRNVEGKLYSYKYLRKGFEVCLRRIFETSENQHRLTIITTMLNWFSMVNMSEDHVLDFSMLLDRVAELYTVTSYSDSFKDGLFSQVLKRLVGSANSVHSLVGCRLLQRLLDRQSNFSKLIMPIIFYQFSQINLTTGTYDSGDKIFIRLHREKIHKYLLRAMRKHCENRVNINAVFATISCIVLEVPCGLTAAAAACLAMSVQDYALNGDNISTTSRYWLHAVVISVMSLICWVHKAPVLYSYVNQIIARRAREAPHLNPPLMPLYCVGHQHVTWNKPTLFFEDWELRYGLWKHFQDAQQLERINTRLSGNVPTMNPAT